MPPIFRIDDLGELGILRDLESHKLADNAWSDGANMQFLEGRATKAPGYTDVKDPATIQPYGLFHVKYLLTNFWVYASLTDARAFNSVTEAEITRTASDYTMGPIDRWTATSFNDQFIMNNGVDDPQVWLAPDLGTLLVDLSNWPASTTCKIIRAYRNFLVALHITESGTEFPHRVKWSHSSYSGVPSSWDETDATLDAGEVDLGNVNDQLVDAQVMGNTLIIYKENTTWVMSFIGGILKMGFRELFRDSGLMAADCAVSLGHRHVCFTRTDIIVHDGQRWESIVEGKNKRYIFDNLDPVAARTGFVMNVQTFNEIWFCVPLFGQSTVTVFPIWNYRYNTWGWRELPGIRAAAAALPAVTSVADTYEGNQIDQWEVLVNDDSASGQKVLKVDITAGFAVGDTALIDEGSVGDGEESKVIASIQDGVSLTMTANLDITHLGASQDIVLNDTLIWDDARFLEAEEKLYFADTDATKIYEIALDRSDFQADGVSYKSSVERTGITISSLDRFGKLVRDPDSVKMLLAVRPRIAAAAGTSIDVYIAAVDDSEDTYSWGSANAFVVGTDVEIVQPVTGRFLGIRFEETGSVEWSLHSVGLEISVVGLH